MRYSYIDVKTGISFNLIRDLGFKFNPEINEIAS